MPDAVAAGGALSAFPPATGPVEVALARSADDIPHTPGDAGAYAYQLKFDGWRLVILRPAHGGVELWSRNGTDLTNRFPEIAAAAAAQIPAGTVVDGEVCVWQNARLDWDQLQTRMGSPARVAELVRTVPASYVAFDVLAVNGVDVRTRPFVERRTLLEGLTGWRPPLQVCPSTTDYDEAVAWFADYWAVGIEGVVAKRTIEQYRAGARSWVKVKHRQTSDMIVGAVTGTLQQPEAVITGRYTNDGRLVITGRTSVLNPAQAAELAAVLTPVEEVEHPWPAEIAGQFGSNPVHLVHVAPTLVVEVSADSALQGGRARHSLRFLRLRADVPVSDVPPGHDVDPDQP
jgi:ATP-dependent DNA ligase